MKAMAKENGKPQGIERSGKAVPEGAHLADGVHGKAAAVKLPDHVDKVLPKKSVIEDELAKILEEDDVIPESVADKILLAQSEPVVMADAALQLAAAESEAIAASGAGAAAGAEAVAGSSAMSLGTMAAIGAGVIGVAALAGSGGSSSNSSSDENGVAAKEAGTLTIQQYAGLATNETWSYAIEDSAANLLAVAADAAVITGANAVTVTGNAVGTLTVQEYSDLAARTTVDTWSFALEDAIANLVVADAAVAVASATAIAVSDEVTVADIDTLIGYGAVLGDSFSYTLADSLANLAAPDNAATVAGASSYTLVIAAGDMGSLTVAEAVIVDGATNTSDYSYTLSASLAELAAFDVVPETYTLTDAAGTLADLAVAEAAIVLGATNGGDYSYSLSDSWATLSNAANAATVAGASSYAISDIGNLTNATVAQANLLLDASNYTDETYSLTDSAANLAGAGATGNAATNIIATDAATVAQATAILALSNSGTTSYSLSDSWAILSDAANAATVAGASSYAISDIGNLTNATVVQANLLLGASNYVSQSYSLSDTLEAVLGADLDLLNGATSVGISGDVQFSADLTAITAPLVFEGGTIAVADGQTLTLTATQANGTIITGDSSGANNANIEITDAVAYLPYDFSGIGSAIGTVRVTFTIGTDLRYDTDLGNATVVVADDQTLTLTPTQANGMIISSSGSGLDNGGTNIWLRGLEVTEQYDFSGITSTNGSVQVIIENGGSLHVATDLGEAAVLVLDDQTLTLSAAQADGMTISGSDYGSSLNNPNIIITDAAATTPYNFAAITSVNGTVTVNLATGGTLDAATNLGNAEVVVAAGQSLTLQAAQANDTIISGASSVYVQGVGTDAFNLNGISVDTTMLVVVESSVTLHPSTDLGNFRVIVAQDTTLNLTAAQADGRTVQSALNGNIEITALADETVYDFSQISSSAGTVTILVETDLLLDPAVNLGNTNIVVADGYSLTLTAAQADSRSISGNDADIVITGTSPATVYDFSAVSSATGTVTVTLTTGALRDGFSMEGIEVVVGDGETLTLTAAQANGATINGNYANIVITDAAAATPYNFSNINMANGTVSVNMAGGTLAATTDLGNAVAIVTDDSILTLSAAQASGSTITGDSNGLDNADIIISGVDVTATYDFSKIGTANGNVEVKIDVGGVLSAGTELGNAWLVIADGESLSLSAAQATGREISASGSAANIEITNADPATVYDFANINPGSGTLNVTFTSSGSLAPATNLGSAAVVVADGTNLFLQAAQADGMTISSDNGSIYIYVTGADEAAPYNFSQIASTNGTVMVYHDGGVLNAGTLLGDAEVMVFDGQTLTLTAAQANGMSIRGESGSADNANVEITDANPTVQYNFANIGSGSGTVTVTFTISGALNPATDLGSAEVVVADGGALTVTAEQANGSTIRSSGSGADDGNVKITGLDGAQAYDFSGLSSGASVVYTYLDSSVMLDPGAVLGELKIYIRDSDMLTLTAAQADGRVIAHSGSGTTGQVQITDMDVAGTAYNFAGIDATAIDPSVTISGGTLNPATDLGDVEVVVADGQTLTLTAAQASGSIISGAGSANIVITDATPETTYDFSTISSAGGTVSVTYGSGTLSASTILGSAAVVVADGQALSLTATQADGRIVTTSGSDLDNGLVLINGIDVTQPYNFSGITTTNGSVLANITSSGELSGEMQLGDLGFFIASDQTLTLTAAQADGRLAEGSTASSTMHITGLDVATRYDLSGLMLTNGTATVNLTTGGTLHADTLLGAVEVVVADGTGLTVTAEQANGSTIRADSGWVEITGLDGAQAYDFSGLSSATGFVYTILDSSVALDTATVLGELGIILQNSDTLTLTAAQANGRVFDHSGSGTGQVLITDGDAATAYDFSGIKLSAGLGGSVTITSGGTLAPATDLGEVEVVVADGQTLTLSAAQASGRPISGDSSGANDANVEITDANPAAQYDFANIGSGNGTVSVTFTISETLNPATVLGSAEVVVAAGVTLTLTVAQANGVTITGGGSVVVTNLGTEPVNLSGIAVEGPVTTTVLTSTQLHATTDLGGVEVVVADDQTLTLSAAQASGATISSSGSVFDNGRVQITGLDGAHAYNFSGLSSGGIVSTYLESSVTLDPGAVLGELRIVVLSSNTLTLTAAQADGRLITGDGTGQVLITDMDVATAYDFSVVDSLGIAGSVTITSGGTLALATVLGDVEVVVADGQTLTLTAAQANGSTISGANDANIVITDADPATAYNFTAVSSATGTVTVTLVTGVWLDAFSTEGMQVVVGDGETLTLTAAQADGMSISGDGFANIVITGATPATVYNFSNISSTSGTVSVTYTISGTLSTSTILGSAEVVVADGYFLTVTAAQASGSTIRSTGTGSNDGSVQIKNINITQEYDFSGITSGSGAVYTSLATGGTFNPKTNLGELDISLFYGIPLTLTAAQADGRLISGQFGYVSHVQITDMDVATAYDFTRFELTDVSGSVEVTSGGTLHTNTQLGEVEVVVADGQTLTLSAAQADGRAISGAGNVTVSGVTATTDLSGLDGTGIVTATVTQNTTLLPGSALQLGDVDVFDVADGVSLTFDSTLSSQLASVTGGGLIAANGSVVNDTIDLSGVDISGFSGDVVINGVDGDDNIRGTQRGDQITGGDGADTFIYMLGDSGVAAGADIADVTNALANDVDVITDFTFDDVAGTMDKIDLSGIAGLTASANLYQSSDAVPQGDLDNSIYVVTGSAANGVTEGDAVVLVNTTGGETTGWADYEMAIYVVGGGSVTWTEDHFILPPV